MEKKQNDNERLKKLTKSLEKKIEQLNKDIKAGKVEYPNSVNVICSQEDIERTMRRKR